MIKVIKNNTRLYLTWLIMILCITIGVATTKFLNIAALTLFLIFIVVSPMNDSCVLLFGLMPLANVFKYSAGTTSFFTICELLIVLLYFYRCKRVKVSFIVSLLVLSLYVLATSMNDLNVLTITKMLLGFCIIYLVITNTQTRDVINISYLLSMSTILTMSLSMNKSYLGYIEPYLLDLNFVLDSSGHESDIMRIGGFLGDPNYCSVLVVVTIAMICVLYYHQKIGNEFWIFAGFLISLGFFTYSKSYFLCVSALILFLIVFVLFPKYKGWAVVSILAVIAVVLLSLSGRIEVFNVVFERFVGGDITTGRSILNSLYLNYIWDNPLVLFFGEGISADRLIGASNNVHNIYIECLFRLGIVGSVLYISTLLISADFRKHRGLKKRFVNFFPMIFVLVLYYALAGITMYELPFYLAIAFITRDLDLLDENDIILSGVEKHNGNKKI